MYQLDDLLLFVAVAENKSFLKTALQFGTSQPTVSRRIKSLTEDLGHQLFISEGKHLVTTEFGAVLYSIIKEKMAYLDELKRAVDELILDNSREAGHLNILLPPLIAEDFITPLIPEFNQKYPNISLFLDYDLRKIDFDGGLYDLAIVFYMPTNQNQKITKLIDSKLGLFCSKDYADKYGLPNSIREMEAHRYFCLTMYGETLPHLKFIHNQTKEEEIFELNNKLVLTDYKNAMLLIKSGEFIGANHEFLFQDDDTIIRVLPEYDFDLKTSVYLLLNPYKKNTIIDLFINFLKQKLRLLNISSQV